MTTSIFTVATFATSPALQLVLGIVGVSLASDKPYSLVAQAMLDASRRGTRTS